jgi:predicted polyphosphate/ATP-dependent NAD kinase
MRLGLIVNPIAGMGGKVGLKGTDDVLEEAVKRGAKPLAPVRAEEFLSKLKDSLNENGIEVLTCPGVMGKEEAESVGVHAEALRMNVGVKTSAEDTKLAVQLMAEAHADLMVFVGGDGTAKDILDAEQSFVKLPVLGVPAGVKMYSGVFAISPSDATEVVLAFARKEAEMTEFEIMDANEGAIRNDVFAIRLYGYLDGPFLSCRIQGSKEVSPDTSDDKENQIAIAKFVIEEKKPESTWILGPGTTVKRVAELLGAKKTLLGVDICAKGNVIMDVDEKTILEKIDDWGDTWILVSPIGHQGIIFGRGNQQISPEVIKRVGKQRLIVLVTKSKIENIEGKMLRVDTGNTEVDNMLKGYIKVVTDYREWRIMLVQ